MGGLRLQILVLAKIWQQPKAKLDTLCLVRKLDSSSPTEWSYSNYWESEDCDQCDLWCETEKFSENFGDI